MSPGLRVCYNRMTQRFMQKYMYSYLHLLISALSHIVSNIAKPIQLNCKQAVKRTSVRGVTPKFQKDNDKIMYSVLLY